jgi:hypothetical protein
MCVLGASSTNISNDIYSLAYLLSSNYFSSFFPANRISNMTPQHNLKLLKNFKRQHYKDMAEYQIRGTLKIQMFYWPCNHIGSTATCPKILCHSPATNSREYGPGQYKFHSAWQQEYNPIWYPSTKDKSEWGKYYTVHGQFVSISNGVKNKI